MISIKNLFRFSHFLVVIYAESPVPKIPEFNQALIPDGKEAEKSRQELQKLVAELSAQKEQARLEREKLAAQAGKISELKEQLDSLEMTT